MRIYGIDFTSRPARSKPITCIEARLDGDTLVADELRLLTSFDQFEGVLQEPGPWIAGIDFPFGQSRRFVENAGWPQSWQDYVGHAGNLGRQGFRTALENYKQDRVPGDKEHRRVTDIAAGSISPQKLYGVPVGLMFFEGAPRLLASGVTVPGLRSGDPDRIVVEAYPGVLARAVIGRRCYKTDDPKRQTAEHLLARRDLLGAITNGVLGRTYGLNVVAPPSLVNDPGADSLDALLCAVQAAWAWRNREHSYGRPERADPLEGWIADPHVANH